MITKTHIFVSFPVLCCHMLHEQLRVYKKRLWPKMCTFIMTFFYHEKPVKYSLCITFWQVMNSLATALFMADTSDIQVSRSKWAVLYGTLVGFIMISIIIIITTILKRHLHRTVVCNKFVFWAFFCITTYSTYSTVTCNKTHQWYYCHLPNCLLTLRLLMSYIQGVPGGRDETSGECSLC